MATTIASLVVAGAAAGFAYSFVSTLAAGGSLGQAFRGGLTGALWGGVTAGLAYGVGHVVAPALTESATGAATEIAAGIGHALVGGALAEAQGGDFWSGLMAAGVGYAGGTAAGAWFKGAAPIDIAARTAISAVAGGTAAELTGGKFANGALTAAFQHLFNAELDHLWEPDKTYKFAIRRSVRVFGATLKAEASYIGDYAALNGVDYHLVRATIFHESRLIAFIGVGEEGSVSWTTSGYDGSYGYAQLGPDARRAANLSIRQAESMRGSIRGAAKWLAISTKQLTNSGVANPSVAQIASQYNSRRQLGLVSEYGRQVEWTYDKLQKGGL